jgi:UDP-3-O-[3-hydroxymyristoyl] N-acetylglucosamine deacetylase
VRQQTISETVSCTGTGLHSGAPVHLTLRPAPVDSGVVFARSDRARRGEVRAHPSVVQSSRLATTLGCGDLSVGTVEHLLSALFGLGIDNIRVEVDGPELPIMDGSAAPFVYLLRSAGILAQPASRPVLRLRRPLEVRDGDRYIRIEPARSFRIAYTIDFDHPAIGRQEYRVDSLDSEHFEREISAARTFGFLNEVRSLWGEDLARGGSLDNTVVLDDTGVVNRDGLRWPDEFVRHKVLDLFGDLAILGVSIQGRLRVERGGHALHQKLVAAIAAHPDAWRLDDPGACVPRGLDLAPVATPA